MLAANVPGRIALPFANGAGVGYKNPIPVASQVGITPGAASYTDGFPPLCFLPLTAGGIAPSGADFNGLLNAITAVQQWQSAGGLFHYDSTFSTAIGGYPAGAMIIGTSNTTTWLNLADNNTTNPDAIDGSAANWVPADAYGIAPISGLTNASVTLLPAQWSKPVITMTGTLTANINIIFPTTAQKWLVVNNTTGAFVVTCKTAAGAGAPVAQGGGQQTFWGDGTNLNPLAGNSSVPFVVGMATIPTHALNQGAGDARYAPIGSSSTAIQGSFKNLAASATGLSALVTVTADELVLENSSNLYKTVRGLSLSINAAATAGGPNAPSTAVVINTWYAIWVWDNGTTPCGTLDLSGTAPTAPTGGYTSKARIGWVRIDGTANKYPLAFKQNGKNVGYSVGGNVSGMRVIANAPGPKVAVSWSAAAPPTAAALDVVMSSSPGASCSCAPNPNYGAIDSAVNPPPMVASLTDAFVVMSKVMIPESTNLYCQGVTNAVFFIAGWEDNL